MDAVLVGSETETAVVLRSAADVRPSSTELARALVEHVAAAEVHACGPPPVEAVYLGNGACVYRDAGGHPEFATAECASPFDLAAQGLALRQLMVEATEAAARRYNASLWLVQNNIDYSLGGGTTYGHHQNTLLRQITPPEAARQLAPLLAAMPPLCGAGRVSFANGSAGYELTQRASFMNTPFGPRTQSARAMITEKDEPLSDRGQRLHIILFDSVISDHQMALVPGIIALVVLLLERGERELAEPVALHHPVQALQTVSCDPSVSARLPLAAGGHTTALDIQRHYLQRVRRLVDAGRAPAWAERLVTMWSELLEQLGRDVFAAAARLDWVAKLLLLTRVLQQHQLGWHDMARWLYVLASVRRLKNSFPDIDLLKLAAGGQAQISQSAFGVLDHHMSAQGLSWKEFPQVWDATHQMCRRCLQYHTLNQQPLTRTERLISDQQIQEARLQPPPGTRAQLRGQAIRDHAGPDTTAYWNYVQSGNRRLRLDDPFGKDAKWVDQPPEPRPLGWSRQPTHTPRGPLGRRQQESRQQENRHAAPPSGSRQPD